MRHIRLLFLLLLLVLVGACKDAKNSKPVIAVSIEPLRFLTEQVAGDRYSVISLVPSGSNPETYEMSTQKMVDLSSCCVCFCVGQLGFERTWISRIHDNLNDLLIVNASDSVVYLKDETGAVDPHVWTSPANLKIMAHNVFNTLCTIDSVNSSYYQKNYESLVVRLDKVDADIRKTLSSTTCRSFAIYHPALTYFSQEYGLIQIAIEGEGKEPTPSQIKNVIGRCRGAEVKTILVQREFDEHNAQSIAREISATLKEINPLSYAIDKELVEIANKLK